MISKRQTIPYYQYLTLFILGIVSSLLPLFLETVPGYMDAEYYFAGARRIFEGQGSTEMILWNYLDDPQGLPHPAHTYWMPLTSYVAALGMFLTGSSDFTSARLIFILIAGLIPPLTAFLSFSLSHRRGYAWLAGLLAVFSGFYFIYLTDTATFSLYMLLGGLFFAVAFFTFRTSGKIHFLIIQAVLLGILAGLMHLTRADGILWLFAALLILLWNSFSLKKEVNANPARSKGFRFLAVVLPVLFAYFVVMSPWFARNLQSYGHLLTPGSSKTLWIANYDQTFTYPASQLNFQQWWAQGIASHLDAWGQALISNLKTLLAVQNQIFLLPLAVIGIVKLRKKRVIQFALILGLATFGLMTFVFPFAGERGGYLHSSSALQPLLWAVIPVGLEGFITTGVRLRNWKPRQSTQFFTTGILILAAMFTSFIFFTRVIGSSVQAPAWSSAGTDYTEVEQFVEVYHPDKSDVVLVNNPPGYYLASGRPSIVIPCGDEQTLKTVAVRYHASILVVDGNIVDDLAGLNDLPGNRDWLDYLGSAGGAEIYSINIQ